MKNISIILGALLLCGASLAHPDLGTPKNYCEPQAEWLTHDYLGTTSWLYLSSNQDGNQLGDCDGAFETGELCPEVGTDPIRDTRLICGYSDPFGDYDGHSEFALGGAAIYAAGGDGVSSGTLACYGEEGHHEFYSPVTVTDAVLGAGATFYVMTQAPSNPVVGPDCGDDVIQPCTGVTDIPGVTCNANEQMMECIGGCHPQFPPGIDGAYLVFVEGTAGHIQWPLGGFSGGPGMTWVVPGSNGPPNSGTVDP